MTEADIQIAIDRQRREEEDAEKQKMIMQQQQQQQPHPALHPRRQPFPDNQEFYPQQKSKWSIQNLLKRVQPQQQPQNYPQQQRSPTKAIARLRHLQNLEAQEKMMKQQQDRQMQQRQPFRGSLWTNQQHEPQLNNRITLMGGQQPQNYPQQRPNQITLMQGQPAPLQLNHWNANPQ